MNYQQLCEQNGWRSCSAWEHAQIAGYRTSGLGSHFINKTHNQSYACELFGNAAWRSLWEIAIVNRRAA